MKTSDFYRFCFAVDAQFQVRVLQSFAERLDEKFIGIEFKMQTFLGRLYYFISIPAGTRIPGKEHEQPSKWAWCDEILTLRVRYEYAGNDLFMLLDYLQHEQISHEELTELRELLLKKEDYFEQVLFLIDRVNEPVLNAIASDVSSTKKVLEAIDKKLQKPDYTNLFYKEKLLKKYQEQSQNVVKISHSH